MEKLYDIEWVEDGINKHETGLTLEEAERRADELEVTQTAGEIRITERWEG